MHMTPRYIKGNTRASDARITWRKCRSIGPVVPLLVGVVLVFSWTPLSSPDAISSVHPAQVAEPERRYAGCKKWHGGEPTHSSVSAPWQGVVRVKEYGSPGCRGVIMIHGANLEKVGEWEHVARKLALDGLRVLVPDFHSDPETKPSARPLQTIIQVLDLLALQLRKETGHAGAGASLILETGRRRQCRHCSHGEVVGRGTCVAISGEATVCR